MNQQTKKRQYFIINKMFDNPDWKPQIKNTAYSDKEVDSIRAKWILEEIKRRKTNEVPITVTQFVKKYKLHNYPLSIVYSILEKNTSNRKKKGHSDSINRLLRKNKSECRISKRIITTVARYEEYNMSLRGVNAKKEALYKFKKIADIKKYILPNKAEDGKLTIIIRTYENTRQKEKFITYKFDTYNQCVMFLMGYTTGLNVAKIKILTRWEIQALEELKRRQKKEL